MIGQTITVEREENGTIKGAPKDSSGNSLSQSAYQPSKAVLDLFARCMKDYQVAYNLQHRPFDYFDGHSLLERTRMDQRTFAAFVGAEWIAEEKRWQWRGRKNTARNKLIGIAAHVIAGILFPTVFAEDDQQQEQRVMARVMRIQLEYHLKRARYDLNFLFMIISALVCPAVFVQPEWLELMQKVKVRLQDGSYQVQQAIDDILSGLQLNIRPIDEIMLGDFYTFEMQKQPFIVEVSRISYDMAKSRYAGQYFMKGPDGKMVDRFDHVHAGKTRVVVATTEKQVLFDIEWTEADPDFVQVLTFKYRSEDLEVEFVGGVFMGNEGEEEGDIYNLNPFKHRRTALVFDDMGTPQWGSIPLYNIAKSGFEPIDPYKRFAYYKSGAFKEYWDDQSINHAYEMLHNGMTLDVIKPLLISGISKVDGTVVAPAAVTALPEGAKVTSWTMSPNLSAAMNVLMQNQNDMSESTIDKILEGQIAVRQTAMAVNAAMTNAKIMLGLFGMFTADLVMQVGDLSMDLIVQNTTVGMLDMTTPGALNMKYKTFLVQGKDHGKDITHRIVYTSDFFGKKMTPAEIRQKEWELWMNDGGKDATTFTWMVNPAIAASMRYKTMMDADQIVERSMGGDRQRKQVAFDMLTDPRVAPYTDQEAVVNDYVIEEYGGNDPERYKRKGPAQQGDQGGMMKALMGNTTGGADAEPAAAGVPTNRTGGAPGQQRNNGQVVPSLPALETAIPH